MGNTTNYVTTASNGEAYANKVAEKLRQENPGATVTVKKGTIPGWGGGYTESGYNITVEKPSKK
ncbi:MAG: hypothetical protein IJH12_07565 [Clostridia bacterium]|nr:hypothetical protein [Clostridia bacterium]